MAASSKELKSEEKPSSTPPIKIKEDSFYDRSEAMFFYRLYQHYIPEFKLTEKEEKAGLTQEKKNEYLFNALLKNLKKTIDISNKDDFIGIDCVQATRVALVKAEKILTEADYVSLYMPTSPPREEKYPLPFKKRLALIWRVYNDHSFYPTPTLSAHETMEQALAKSKKLRLQIFYNFLKETQFEFSSKSYKKIVKLIVNDGTGPIDSPNILILDLLKKRLQPLLWDRYEIPTLSTTDKRIMTTALLHWIYRSDATEILRIADPSHTILEEIKKLFAYHGSPPAAAEKILKEQLSKLTFFSNGHPKHAHWLTIVNILNLENRLIGQEERNAAVVKIKTWILENYDVDNPEHKFITHSFYEMYKAYQSLTELQPPLVSSRKKEEYTTLFNLCIRYFNAIKMASTPISSVTPDEMKMVQALMPTLEHTKSEMLHEPIQQFFKNWYKSYDLEYRKPLYAILLNETNHSKIVLSDEMLRDMLEGRIVREDKEEKAGEMPFRNFYNLSYKVNRIFLHAIMIRTEYWTPLFTEALQKVVRFVKNNVEHPESILQKNAYPEILLTQLDYLIFITQTPLNPPLYPESEMILLPQTAKTIQEYELIFKLLPEDKHIKLYRLYADKINAIICSAIHQVEEFYKKESYFRLAMSIVPKTDRDFIKFVIELGNLQLNACFLESNDRFLIDYSLPEKSKAIVINELTEKTLQKIVHADYVLWPILQDLSKENQILLLTKLGNIHLQHIIKHNFNDVLPNLISEIQLILLNMLGRDCLILHYKDAYYVAGALEKIPEDNQRAFLRLLGNDHVHDIIYNREKTLYKRSELLEKVIFKEALALALTHETIDQMSKRAAYIVSCYAYPLPKEKRINKLKRNIENFTPVNRFEALALIHRYLQLKESEPPSPQKAKSQTSAEVLLEYLMRGGEIPRREPHISAHPPKIMGIFSSANTPLLANIFDKVISLVEKQRAEWFRSIHTSQDIASLSERKSAKIA